MSDERPYPHRSQEPNYALKRPDPRRTVTLVTAKILPGKTLTQPESRPRKDDLFSLEDFKLFARLLGEDTETSVRVDFRNLAPMPRGSSTGYLPVDNEWRQGRISRVDFHPMAKSEATVITDHTMPHQTHLYFTNGITYLYRGNKVTTIETPVTRLDRSGRIVLAEAYWHIR